MLTQILFPWVHQKFFYFFIERERESFLSHTSLFLKMLSLRSSSSFTVSILASVLITFQKTGLFEHYPSTLVISICLIFCALTFAFEVINFLISLKFFHNDFCNVIHLFLFNSYPFLTSLILNMSFLCTWVLMSLRLYPYYVFAFILCHSLGEPTTPFSILDFLAWC